jgi:hypothetical protein
MEQEGGVSNQEKSGGLRPPLAKTIGRRNYFFASSFLSVFGLHFSQVFLFFTASTQHLCEHSLPAFLASSQQPAFTEVVAATNSAQTITDNSLILFMCNYPFLPLVVVAPRN